MFKNLKCDIPAGIAIFFIAIPLSLGIALASGAPLFSGVIASIIGGLIVAPLSGSTLGVSGAAAGLVILMLNAIETLGFSAFLVTVVLAGLLQVFMGLAKMGSIAHYFPSSVIKGMLSGIGVIIFLKQIPHAMGHDDDYEGDLSFIQSDSYSTFTELAHILEFSSPTAILISIVSLIILIFWERPKIKKSNFFQVLHGTLITIIAGVLINQFLQTFYPDVALKETHLVNLPIAANIDELLGQMHSPDFSQLRNPAVYASAMMLAFIASLETLLSVEAVDRLDPYRRVTAPNRELIAQGIGNITSGLLGGLPITQVIIRSSINIQSGAKTQASGFVSGSLLFITVFLMPEWLNKIPLASLASILLVVGYKLARPRVFKKMYRAGRYHFIPFCATILGLIFTNLLIGIIIGLAAALLSIVLENYKAALYFRETRIGNKIIFRLSEHVSFLNKATMKQTFDQLPTHSEIVIDATRSKYLDYDVFEVIRDFQKEAPLKQIQLTLQNVRGFGILKPVEKVQAHTYESQQALTPAEVLQALKEGNANFVNNLETNRNFLEQVNDTSEGQFPIAIILSCMDSRTSTELIFDQGLGDVFSTRVAGNIVNDDILGSMEYACKVAGSKLIVVLGHTHCGAIKGACAQVELDHLTGLLDKIKPSVQLVCTENHVHEIGHNDTLIQQVADKNVRFMVEQIKQRSRLLNDLLQNGSIDIVGGMYDVETGKVQFYSEI
ncbi:MAG: carbonic anhydrase family protein [Methylococcales bacterium]|nr:carbonic anhydrase family protein [Methylococcales bacterium]MDD5753411.1 carbonic anhydrase family protein [Methylococcales bacterium]